jgi:hypothetical protein
MDRSPNEIGVQIKRRRVRLCRCRAPSPKDRKPVKSGRTKFNAVRSVGLMSKTQEAGLSPTKSNRRSRVGLGPEYEVQKVQV